MTESKERTLNEVVDSFANVEDIDESDKVWMFIQLANDKALIEELKKHALCLKLEMVPPSIIHDFAYAILKLAKPHLFDEEGK